MTQTKPSKRKVLFWNAAGSVVTALASFIYPFIILRYCGTQGPDLVGDYSLTIAIAQLMYTIGVFEATTYFATDTLDRFSSEQYFAFKFLSCGAMAVVSVIYVLYFGLTSYQVILALWLCAFKLIDAFSMYFFAAFQKVGRLDISGFSSVWQVVLSLVGFGIVCVLTQNLIWATIAATVIDLIWTAVYNGIRMKQICPIQGPDFKFRAMKQLFLELFPLFLATFLAGYLANLPKYAIDVYWTTEMQAVFGILFMPSFVINLFLIFIMRPALTPLSKKWNEGQVKPFTLITLKILGAVVVITIAVLVGCWFLGIPILGFFYPIITGEDLTALMIVMTGGGLMGASNVLYNALIIQRKQHYVLGAYAIAVVIGALIADPLTSAYGLNGACMTYLLSSLALFVLYLVVYIGALIKMKKRFEEKEKLNN